MNQHATVTAIELGVMALVSEITAFALLDDIMPRWTRVVGRIAHLNAVFAVAAVAIIILFPSKGLNP